MVPPSGFVAATKFSGFQNEEKGASIMVTELPPPYQQIADGFTAEALKMNGMTLVSRNTVDFNNSKATLIKVTQSANGTTFIKQMLLFGTGRETVMINGIYPEASKSMEEKIRQSLFSTVYNADQNLDPAGAAPFTVNVEGTRFKPARLVTGSLLYSVDGEIPTEKPTIIITNSLSKVVINNQEEFARQRLKRLPQGQHNEVREIREVTIDNMKGYEIVADGKTKEGKPELVVQTMLFKNEGEYYIILAQAKEDFEANLKTFRQITATFKRK